MSRPWEADLSAGFSRRLGLTAAALGDSRDEDDCPEIWELTNGDIAVVGRDLTDGYRHRLPRGMSIGSDERLVVIPGNMLRSAKPDIADV